MEPFFQTQLPKLRQTLRGISAATGEEKAAPPPAAADEPLQQLGGLLNEWVDKLGITKEDQKLLTDKVMVQLRRIVDAVARRFLAHAPEAVPKGKGARRWWAALRQLQTQKVALTRAFAGANAYALLWLDSANKELQAVWTGRTPPPTAARAPTPLSPHHHHLAYAPQDKLKSKTLAATGEAQADKSSGDAKKTNERFGDALVAPVKRALVDALRSHAKGTVSDKV